MTRQAKHGIAVNQKSDRSHEAYKGSYLSEKSQRELRDRVSWMLSNIHGEKILDIGCSQGMLSILAAKRGKYVDGVDPDSEAIAYAQQVLKSENQDLVGRVAFYNDDIKNIKSKLGKYDTIFLGEVIEHLQDPFETIEIARRLLKSDGVVIMTTPFGVLRHPDHFHTFYLSSFSDLVYPFFDQVRIEIIGKRICFVGKPKSSVDHAALREDVSYKNLLRISEKSFFSIEEEYLADIEDRKCRSIRQQEYISKLKSDNSRLKEKLSRYQAFAKYIDLAKHVKRGVSKVTLRPVFAIKLFTKKKIILIFKKLSGKFSCHVDSVWVAPLLPLLLRLSTSIGYIILTALYRDYAISKAESLLKYWKPKSYAQMNLSARIHEISSVLDNGPPQSHPLLETRQKSMHGAVMFVLHNSLPYDSAGYAVRSQQVLFSLNKKGIDAFAVTRMGYPSDLSIHYGKKVHDKDIVDGVMYLRLPSDDQNIYQRVPDSQYVNRYGDILAELAVKKSAPIIHSASCYINGLASVYAARKTGGMSVYEVRGLWYLSRAIKDKKFANSELYKYWEIMEKSAILSADKVVTISDALKAEIVKMGRPANSVYVVPNAVDTGRFSPIKENSALKNRLGLNGKIVIGFLGSLTDYEGIDLIIKSIDILIARGSNVALLIVGSGYSEKSLMTLRDRMVNRESIIFTGKVPYDEVNDYYSIFDICPFPRMDYEVCRYVPPLKVLEVMAMSKAVIVSDVAPLRELVVHEETGLICRAGDLGSLVENIQMLVESGDLRMRISNNAHAWVKNNRDWSVVSNLYMDVYGIRADAAPIDVSV